MSDEKYHMWPANTYQCVDCGRVAVPCRARADGEDTYVGYHPCECGSKDQFGHTHQGKFPKLKETINT